MLKNLFLLLVLGVGLLPEAVAAQTVRDTRDALIRIADEVDRRVGGTRGLPPAVRQLENWKFFRNVTISCLQPVTINGQPVTFAVAPPSIRSLGDQGAVVSRGFEARNREGETIMTLQLSQTFIAHDKPPTVPPKMFGVYHMSSSGQPIGLVDGVRWTDSPRAGSVPPQHQPWGPALTMLARSLIRCKQL